MAQSSLPSARSSSLRVLHGLFTVQHGFDPQVSRLLTGGSPGDGARLAFNPRANVCRRGFGFNLSHSLGLLVFGGVALALGWRDFGVFADSLAVQALTLLVAASYFVLSLRFWFWGPAVGSGAALLCFLLSAFLCWRHAAA
jgi:hypothetical protein